MNSVKVTMGMIEVGAAFKFLSVADLAWNPVPLVFDYALVMTAWLVILVTTGLYLLGLFRLSHDTNSGNISVLRLTAAMLFLGLAGYLAVGLYASEKPSGKLWEQIAAFAPQKIEGGVDDLGPFLKHDGLNYALDYERAVALAKSKNQPLFLDFTGVNCVNCRLMERRMGQPHNRSQLEKFIRVQLYTDNVPSITDQGRVDALLAKNRDLQENWFRDATLPSYAVVSPDGRTLLAAFSGVEKSEGEFAEFLEAGYRLWAGKQGGRQAMSGVEGVAPR
jgi:thiol:disulfide interchange protein DsbD